MTTLISVCIPTYRRASLSRTLASIAAQTPPPDCAIEVVVIDNDHVGSAGPVVAAFTERVPFQVTYAVEPVKGLSRVRNRTLALARGDWLALIDDDEVAGNGWLQALLATARTFKADAVIGTVLPQFTEPAPQWLVDSGFFELSLPPTGERVFVGDALCGNALLSTAFLKAQGLTFDAHFDSTGGEDTDFFARFERTGGVIVSSREALVRELVGRERLTRDYALLRSTRIGEIHARVTHRHGTTLALVRTAVRACINIVGACVLMAGALLSGGRSYYRYRFALARNLGKLRYCLGLRPVEMYASPPRMDKARAS